MRRREFLAGAACTALGAALPGVAHAQPVGRVPRIAWLSIPQAPQWIEAFREGLADAGFVDGRTVVVEQFIAPTSADLMAVSMSAVASGPDVISPMGTPAALAAQRATSTIPIVFGLVSDPLGAGLVKSLAMPGGNITGTSNGGVDVIGKQLAVLKEVLPSLRRLAVLNVPTDPVGAVIRAQVRAEAVVLGIEIQEIDLAGGEGPGQQFQRVVAARPEAVYVPALTYFASNRDALFDLLREAGLPALSSGGALPGSRTPFIGMLAYGPSTPTVIRRTAVYAAAVLKGAKPGELPVEQPGVFDFAVNLDTARRLGITLPQGLVALATDVADSDWRANPR